MSYWSQVILSLLQEDRDLTVAGIAKRSGIKETDVVYVLKTFGILRYEDGEEVMNTEPEFINRLME